MIEPEKLTEGQRSYRQNREYNKARSREYYQTHKVFIKVKYANWRSKLKQQVFSHYANGEPKCAVCGEKNLELLVLDHINGDGKQHHVANRYSYGTHMWSWAKKNNYPAIFQVLCYKHNTAKGHEAFIPKAQLEEWLVRLEQPRAGSIFDNHAELGMIYVLKKLLGKPVKNLEEQATAWRNQIMKNFYENLEKENKNHV